MPHGIVGFAIDTASITVSNVITASTNVSTTTIHALPGSWNQPAYPYVADLILAERERRAPMWHNHLYSGSLMDARRVLQNLSYGISQAIHDPPIVPRPPPHVAARFNAEAVSRANVLLNEHLSPSQRLELAKEGYFTLRKIDVKSGEIRTYRIRRGRSRNVDLVNSEGRKIVTLCAHPVEMMPDEDTMLAQKLWLESCEEDFLRIANRS